MKTSPYSDLRDRKDLHWLDVRPAAAFQAGHLPASLNNCVFEMGFIERMPDDWHTGVDLVVVGQSADGHGAEMAAEKLERAGYASVVLLEGGIESAGIDARTPEPELPILHGEVPVDRAVSEIQWIGRNLLNRHVGTLGFSEARLIFDRGAWTGGEFEIDWQSLACADLAGSELHGLLMRHLKDHDFFDVDHYDAPRVRITRVQTMPEAMPGTPNALVTAELTLKDVTRELEFDAVTGRDPEGRFALSADFSFDRTKWNVNYGSGKLFHNLGMHLVNDRVGAGLKIVGG